MKKILVAAMIALFAICAFAQEKEVARYSFTTAISDREPVDQLSTFTPVEGTSLYFFTELKNMEGEAHHLWYKNGELVYDCKSKVNGPRWGTSSSMKSAHFKARDEVKVEVTDASGTVLATEMLTIN